MEQDDEGIDPVPNIGQDTCEASVPTPDSCEELCEELVFPTSPTSWVFSCPAKDDNKDGEEILDEDSEEDTEEFLPSADGRHNYSNPNLKASVDLAFFRLNIILPAINNYHNYKSASEYFKAMSKREFCLPDKTIKCFSAKTFQKWLEKFKKGGFDALMPQTRSDKGQTRVLSEEAQAKIKELVETNSERSAPDILQYLQDNGFVPKTVGVSTIQRFIKVNNLKEPSGEEAKDRKRFEADAFCKIWQADTCKLCVIEELGVKRWVYVVGIIDDHSRVIVCVRCFYNDNAANFQIVFMEAIRIYGIPNILYVDNGGPYANEQLSLICGELGVQLVHAPVRDGAAKGKIERWWRTLQKGYLAWLNLDEIHSIQEMDMSTRKWTVGYNNKKHKSIKCTPFERMKASLEKHEVRRASSEEWLRTAFCNRITRTVTTHNTISIDTICFDVPPQFHDQEVEVRFVPGYLEETIYIYQNEKKYPIKVSDPNKNCNTKRDIKKTGSKKTVLSEKEPPCSTEDFIDFSKL